MPNPGAIQLYATRLRQLAGRRPTNRPTAVPPPLPPGRVVNLPGRGDVFVRDLDQAEPVGDLDGADRVARYTGLSGDGAHQILGPHAGRAPGAVAVAAVCVTLGVHLAQLALPGSGREPEIEEARSGDLHRCDVAIRGNGRGQCLGDRARIAARGPCQQHRGIAGEVAVRAVLGTLDHEVGRGEVGGQGALLAEGCDALFDQGLER